MDYNKIIKDINKYHYLHVHNHKCILLSSDDILANAKNRALAKIQSKLALFKGKIIIRLKFKKIKKSIYDKSLKSALTGIGGPIVVDINLYNVTTSGKMKMDDSEDRNNTLYFTESYLKKNKQIKKAHLKTIAIKVYYNKLDTSVLSINKIDDIV